MAPPSPKKTPPTPAPVPRTVKATAPATKKSNPAAIGAAPPVHTAVAGPAPLDLKTLEQRLRDTKAIGVFTKLTLKNQVDDLLGKFRTFYSGTTPPTLPDLRQAYEGLLLKVLTVLQDSDPALAHDINASREALWGLLSDRNKFATL